VKTVMTEFSRRLSTIPALANAEEGGPMLAAHMGSAYPRACMLRPAVVAIWRDEPQNRYRDEE